MGRCHEFGSQIREGCGHPMRAGERACACPECGVVCQGQFDGCPDVWARGPRPVSFTATPAIDAPRVRALAAAPEPARASARAQSAPSAPPTYGATDAGPTHGGTANGGAPNGRRNGNGYSSPPPPPPTPPRQSEATAPPPDQPAASRGEILQWFEDAFDQLRNELHAVVSAVTRQQAMLAELLDSREAELRVVMVAESLPELAGEAAAKALTDQSDGLADIVAEALDDFRASTQAAELSNVAVMDGMRELLRRVELTAEINTEAAHDEGAARLESLRGSVGRQIKPLSAAVAHLAARVDTAEERDADRTRALKASVTRQLTPLAAAVAASVERSDQQLADINARLDALFAAAKAPAPPRKPAPRPAAPRKAPAVRKKATTQKAAQQPAPVAKSKPRAATTARKRLAPAPADPEVTVLYDYDEPPPAAPPLLLRRRGATPGG